MSARRVALPRVPSILVAGATIALALAFGTAPDADLAASWARRSAQDPRARAALSAPQADRATSPESLAPEDLGLDKDGLRRASVTTKSAGGPPHAMRCNDLALVLDGFGGFGSASAGGDAHFDAGDGARASVFEAMAHLRGAGYLDADSLALPQSAAGSWWEGASVRASYVRGPFRFDLRSTLVDCSDRHAGALVQEWTITNVSARDQNLGFSVYVDGDLFFEGDHRDDFGVRAEDALWQFDQAAVDAPATYLRLSSEAPQAPQVRREIGEYSDQRRRINRNELLTDGLRRSTGADADRDDDGVTDSGFDVSMALGHEFGPVPPGAVRSVTTRLEWGVGRISDALPQELAVSLGPDREVECEGHEGTLVGIEAQVDPPDAGAAFAWTVDGAPAGSDAAIAALLAPGDHEIAVTVTDSRGATASDSMRVSVRDGVAPEVEVTQEIVLWPPDHRLVPVELPLVVRDGCSEATSVRVLSIVSNEPDEAGRGGDGRFETDAAIIAGQPWLRRERQGGGEDRVYLLTCEVADAAGNATTVEVSARVPHDRR